MKHIGAASLTLILIGLAAPTMSHAGAWTQPKGKGQAIVKYENMQARRGFDPGGDLVDLSDRRRDQSLNLFAEYGLSDSLSFQLKADYQKGREGAADYDGRGPVEVGLTWQAWRDDSTAISLYGGVISNGDGRNALYAPVGLGGTDWEARLSVGRSFSLPGPQWMPDRSFIDVQVARRFRQSLPDETRLDITVGDHLSDDWLVMAQVFAGQSDRWNGAPGARWGSIETSAIRHIGDWSLQAGWRYTAFGRETPRQSGPVIGIWRRF